MFSACEYEAMERALNLALSGGKNVFPNPMVGAVILSPQGDILSEGFHACCGGPHAEVDALGKVDDAKGCTLVVTLEPCCHHGRTPPCAQAIIHAGISRVVVGMIDPNPLVSGKGITFLRENGVDVETGLLESKAVDLNRMYLHHGRTGRSYLHLKMAGTLDGCSAASDGSSRWITGIESRRMVHKFRRDSHGVLIGAGTAVKDNPELTVRELECSQEDQPVRLVLADVSLPDDLKLFKTPGRTVIATGTDHRQPEGVEVWRGISTLEQLLQRTAQEGLGRILCEGGATLAASLLRNCLVDRLSIFTAPVFLGGTGLSLLGDLGTESIDEVLRMKDVTVTRVGADTLTEGALVYRTD